MQNGYRYHWEAYWLNFILYIKNYLDYFPGRLKYAELGKSTRLSFECQCQKLLSLYHIIYILLFYVNVSTKLYQGLWFNWTHLLLFQNMSTKLHINFFLSSGGYNFKINYLKNKMRHGMRRVHILLNNLALLPLQRKYYFWQSRSKCHEKTVKFYLEIFEFKFFVRSNN